MTTAHVEKFAELVGKDPALQAKLGLDKVNADAAAAAASAAAFISNAVKEAKEKPKRSQSPRNRIHQRRIPRFFGRGGESRGKRRTIRYAVGSRGGRAEKHR